MNMTTTENTGRRAADRRANRVAGDKGAKFTGDGHRILKRHPRPEALPIGRLVQDARNTRYRRGADGTFTLEGSTSTERYGHLDLVYPVFELADKVKGMDMDRRARRKVERSAAHLRGRILAAKVPTETTGRALTPRALRAVTDEAVAE